MINSRALRTIFKSPTSPKDKEVIWLTKEPDTDYFKLKIWNNGEWVDISSGGASAGGEKNVILYKKVNKSASAPTTPIGGKWDNTTGHLVADEDGHNPIVDAGWSENTSFEGGISSNEVVYSSNASFLITLGDKTSSWITPIKISGADGAQGEKGDKGDQGDTGPQGQQGNTGATGPQGPAGANGTNGSDGLDGEDGDSIEFIYCLCLDESQNNFPAYPSSITSPFTEVKALFDNVENSQTGYYDYTSGGKTTRWYDKAQEITETYKVEYTAIRYKINSTDGEWNKYTNPTIWAKWGIEGKDGDGVEYIFKKSTSEPSANDAPNIDVSLITNPDIKEVTTACIQCNDYYPGIGWFNSTNKETVRVKLGKTEGPTWDTLWTSTADYLASNSGYGAKWNWTDDPVGTDAVKIVEWCSKRRYDGTTKQWLPFGTPSVWNRYQVGRITLNIKGNIKFEDYLDDVSESAYTIEAATNYMNTGPFSGMATGDLAVIFPEEHALESRGEPYIVPSPGLGVYKYNGTWSYFPTGTTETASLTIGDAYISIRNGHLIVWDGQGWNDVGRVQGTDGTSYYLYIKFAVEVNPDVEPAANRFQAHIQGDAAGTQRWLKIVTASDPLAAQFIGYLSTSDTSQESNYSSYSWTPQRGEDAYGYEYIYTATSNGYTEQEVPPIPIPTYARCGTDQERAYWGAHSTDPDFSPTCNGVEWSDNQPVKNSSDHKYIWCVWRKKRAVGGWSRFYGVNGETGPEATDVPKLYDKYVSDGQDGEDGYNVATPRLYIRSDSAPTIDWNYSITYNFQYGTLSPVPTNWSTTVPTSNGKPCYMTTATVISRETTDIISYNEWAAPILYVEDGYNSSPVILYKRSNSTPSEPSNTLTYSFSQRRIISTTPLLEGWTQYIPAINGNPCYITQATALSRTDTDDILPNEWSAVQKFVEDGDDGQPGAPAYNLYLTNQNASVNTDDNGVILIDAVKPSCTAILYCGSTPVQGATYSVSGYNQISINASTGELNTNNFTSFPANTRSIVLTITASVQGIETTFSAQMTITRSIDGVVRWLSLSDSAFIREPDYVGSSPYLYRPTTITATAYKQIGGETPTEITNPTIQHVYHYKNTTTTVTKTGTTINPGDVTVTTTSNPPTYVTINLYKDNTSGAPIVDTQTIPIYSPMDPELNGAVIRGPYMYDDTKFYNDGTVDGMRHDPETQQGAAIKYIDVVYYKADGAVSGNYYYCKQWHNRSNPHAPGDNNWWAASDKFKFISTEVLLADTAKIWALTGGQIALVGSTSDTINAGMQGGTVDSNGNSQINIFAGVSEGAQGGQSSISTARFRVLNNGTMYATNANIKGHVEASSGSFSGALNAATGTFSGSVNVTGNGISGELSNGALKFKSGNDIKSIFSAGTINGVNDFVSGSSSGTFSNPISQTDNIASDATSYSVTELTLCTLNATNCNSSKPVKFVINGTITPGIRFEDKFSSWNILLEWGNNSGYTTIINEPTGFPTTIDLSNYPIIATSSGTFNVRVTISCTGGGTASATSITYTTTSATIEGTAVYSAMHNYYGNGFAIGSSAADYCMIYKIPGGNMALEFASGTYGMKINSTNGVQLKLGGTWYTASRDSSGYLKLT